MKISPSQLQQLIQEVIDEENQVISEGHWKEVFGEFQDFMDMYDLSAEDIHGMLDMIGSPEAPDDEEEDGYDYEEEDFLSTASPEEVIARYSKNIKEAHNKWDPLAIVMKHRGKLDVTAGMSDEDIMLVNTHCPKTIEDYASQITDHPAIKDEYTALGDWQYQENIERMIGEELTTMVKEGFFSDLGNTVGSLGRTMAAGAKGGDLAGSYQAAYERCKHKHKVDGAGDEPSMGYLRKCYKQIMSSDPEDANIIAQTLVDYKKQMIKEELAKLSK